MRTPLSVRSRLAVRLATPTLLTALAVSGLGAPVSRPTPILEGRVQTLTAATVAPGWQAAIRTPLPTELVSFQWDGVTRGAVELRVRNASGWTAWTHVEGNPAEGPDSDSREFHDHTSAGPVWVGKGVRDVQVRVAEGALHDVQLRAIRSEEPTPSRWSLPAASAEPAAPGIISRAGWGADESIRNQGSDCVGAPAYADNVHNAFVHHTVNGNSYGPDDVAAIIRGIYYDHVRNNGWCDIGYNFLVDRFGRVYEGRAGGVDRAVIGAHAGGFNTGSTGVALIGTFDSVSVPAAMYGGLEQLLAWKFALHGVDGEGHVIATAGSFSGSRFAQGTQVYLWTISGHRDVDYTDCPGGLAYNTLNRLRADVQRDVMNSAPYPFAGWRPASSGPGLLSLDAHGGLHPAGHQSAVPHSGFWPGWAIARGAVADAGGGYVLDGWGGVHPFANAPPVPATNSYWPGWDIARGLARGPSPGSGWVLDGWGGLHSYGGAPLAIGGPYWPGWDIARGVATGGTRTGGYVVDGWGGVHPFGTAPIVASTNSYWPGWDIARGIAVRPDGRSGYVLDGWGGMHAFGGAPALATPYYFPGQDVARGITLTASGNGGWVQGVNGELWAFGDAPVIPPSLTWTGTGLGRGVVMTVSS